jgi:hypothetical protein
MLPPVDQDEQHLNLLSLFHYVVAGVTALFACFGLIYVVLGVLMVTQQLDKGQPPPAAMGWLFLAFGGVFALGGWVVAALTAIAGLRLKQRRSRVFCMVVAAIQCLNMPLGLILGVFTLVVLSRPTVIAMFDGLQQPVP